MKQRSPWAIAGIILGSMFLLLFLFVILPVLILFNGEHLSGNIALIPVNGVITGNGASTFGSAAASSEQIVHFIEEAEENPLVKGILIEINSPGGSAVASDEIGKAIKLAKKPVVSVIREVGASGGYWIASATDHVIANRMSITGSVGVISSYLEFSGLLDNYNITYQRMVAGSRKDLGTPLKKLTEDERVILQSKLDKIHDYFIQEIAENREMTTARVTALATGEFYLGIEAFELGLVDQLGDRKEAEEYFKKQLGMDEVEYSKYTASIGFLEAFSGVISQYFFNVGEGIGTSLTSSQQHLYLS